MDKKTLIEEYSKEQIDGMLKESKWTWSRNGLPVVVVNREGSPATERYAIAKDTKELDEAARRWLSKHFYEYNAEWIAESTGVGTESVKALQNLKSEGNKALGVIVDATCGIDVLLDNHIAAEGYASLVGGLQEEIFLPCGYRAYKLD